MDQGLKDLYFFSDFLNRSVCDSSGQRVGKIVDVVAERAEPYPMIIGLIIQRRRKEKRRYFPWEKIVRIEPQVTLAGEHLQAIETMVPEKDIVLLREVMDKQIVDTFGAKVVRVNDLHFLRMNDHLRLVHVDVGFRGLMRRVGWEKAVDRVF